MIIGPTLIKRCQACAGLVKEASMVSGHTKGATYWTDGAMLAPRLIITPALIKCPHCNSLQWSKSLEEIESISDSKSELASFYVEGELEDLLTFAQANSNTEQQLKIRMLAWRKGNDTRRHSIEQVPLLDSEVENLNAMWMLMNAQQSSDRVVQAEILRELGRFEDALRIIKDSIESPNELAHFIYELIEQKQMQVCEINLDEDFQWRMKERVHEQKTRILPDFDPNGPPVFEIKTRDWWVKILGMLCHNWALIETHANETITVYFFHELGTTLCLNPDYDYDLLENRCAVVDSLDFETMELALQAMRVNGFCNLKKTKKFLLGAEPFGHFYDARASEEGIYSKKGHWIK